MALKMHIMTYADYQIDSIKIDYLACVAGVQRGGRGEVKFEARSLGSGKRSLPDPNDCASRSSRISGLNITSPSLPLVRRRIYPEHYSEIKQNVLKMIKPMRY